MDSASRGFRHQGKHPGFSAVQSGIEKREGVSRAAAGRILGAASRNASPAAKKKNPRLKKVKGGGKHLAKFLEF